MGLQNPKCRGGIHAGVSGVVYCKRSECVFLGVATVGAGRERNGSLEGVGDCNPELSACGHNAGRGFFAESQAVHPASTWDSAGICGGEAQCRESADPFIQGRIPTCLLLWREGGDSREGGQRRKEVLGFVAEDGGEGSGVAEEVEEVVEERHGAETVEVQMHGLEDEFLGAGEDVENDALEGARSDAVELGSGHV